MTEPANTGTSTAEGTQTGQEDPEGTGSTQDPGKAKEAAEPDYKALYEKTLAESRKWESRSKDNASKAKKWDEAEAANRTEAEKAAARAEQAEARAKTAITSAVNAEIRAAASAWTNPADAVRYLDDKDRYIGDDGEIDTKAIAEDVAAAAKERPYLLAANGSGKRGPNPDPGQGARGSASITDQIRDAERKGDHRTALALKAQQLLSANKR
ncbi:hypothetical protein [Labedaea rhizosphaerae]|uniref:Minor structural protein GP20 n=1 Tax=Labedaea rhizosphaerae TaxID=598644 RepID=A0A4R6SHY0_LABRH|nr:hypothetical protein [Labedaea rhizosphaerae]TDQ01253.1 hypothetical protein EV186_1021121 [Labedaea rhizosphaerae]